MKILTIFLVVWLALILLAKLMKVSPENTKEIRQSYPTKLILKGFLSPTFLEGKFSDDHFRIFVDFRRRYILFWFTILAVSAALMTLSYFQFKNESDDFMNRMQEKYLSS